MKIDQEQEVAVVECLEEEAEVVNLSTKLLWSVTTLDTFNMSVQVRTRKLTM